MRFAYFTAWSAYRYEEYKGTRHGEKIIVNLDHISIVGTTKRTVFTSFHRPGVIPPKAHEEECTIMYFQGVDTGSDMEYVTVQESLDEVMTKAYPTMKGH